MRMAQKCPCSCRSRAGLVRVVHLHTQATRVRADLPAARATPDQVREASVRHQVHGHQARPRGLGAPVGLEM